MHHKVLLDLLLINHLQAKKKETYVSIKNCNNTMIGRRLDIRLAFFHTMPQKNRNNTHFSLAGGYYIQRYMLDTICSLSIWSFWILFRCVLSRYLLYVLLYLGSEDILAYTLRTTCAIFCNHYNTLQHRNEVRFSYTVWTTYSKSVMLHK